MQEKNAIKTCFDPAEIPLILTVDRLLFKGIGRQETIH
jgi:hypothetical protein